MNHCHHSHEQLVDYSRVFLIAIFANLGFTIVEAIIAFIAHSSSLLADAGHNLGDVVGLVMAYGANWLAQLEPKKKFSYGYKRTTILSAFFNAIILILTSVFIGIHAIKRLLYPSFVVEEYIIIAAAIGTVVNALTALLFMRQGEDLNIKAAFLHLSYDALISIGVVVAGVVIYFTEWHWVDPIVGLIIVLVMLYGTWGLFKQSLDMVMDAVPEEVDIDQVRAFFMAWPGVEDVHDLHIWGLSTQEVALTAHLYMPKHPGLSRDDYMKINCELKKRFSIGHVTLQVEKDVLGDEKGNINCGC